MFLKEVWFSPNILTAMGKVLGPHTRDLGLDFYSVAVVSQAMWDLILAALPHLTVVAIINSVGIGPSMPLSSLSAACQAAKRHMLVQPGEGQLSEHGVAAVGNEWMRVAQV